MAGKRFESAEDFLRQMDLGVLDEKFHDAIERLTPQQLKKAVEILIERMRRWPDLPINY